MLKKLSSSTRQPNHCLAIRSANRVGQPDLGAFSGTERQSHGPISALQLSLEALLNRGLLTRKWGCTHPQLVRGRIIEGQELRAGNESPSVADADPCLGGRIPVPVPAPLTIHQNHGGSLRGPPFTQFHDRFPSIEHAAHRCPLRRSLASKARAPASGVSRARESRGDDGRAPGTSRVAPSAATWRQPIRYPRAR